MIYTSYRLGQDESASRITATDKRILVNGVFREGAIVGSEILEEDTYENSATAAIPSSVAVISRKKLIDLATRNLEFLESIHTVLSQQVRKAEVLMPIIRWGTVGERARLAIREFTVNGEVVVSRKILSARIGMDRKHFNRAIAQRNIRYKSE